MARSGAIRKKAPEVSRADRLTERGTSSISIRLEDDLIAWLDSVAAAENRSRANLIETILKRARKTVSGTGPQESVL